MPVDDTALAVTDTGGPGIAVVYLNGQFATQGYWRRVIAELGTGWRHITYDERARGKKSKRSADYSVKAAVRDVDAVLAARGVDRPLLVGWSYGAVVAAHWASQIKGGVDAVRVQLAHGGRNLAVVERGWSTPCSVSKARRRNRAPGRVAVRQVAQAASTMAVRSCRSPLRVGAFLRLPALVVTRCQPGPGRQPGRVPPLAGDHADHPHPGLAQSREATESILTPAL